MVLIGKSLDSGVEKVAREVLKTSFELRPDSEGISVAETAQGSQPCLPIRDEVINRVAALVGEKHKVSLTNPDKVILIEVFKVSSSQAAMNDMVSGPLEFSLG
ncbi:unnamed protein product [Parascedosporium putredinis]|uniref:THUMP domain-containing protein n=1 Tax=Parascedosporium putredinis TaxID=1442378 RepID=A0A9P1H3C9_9PEZI|nr:unnamed protein product [Parascedosporium putredinis]CAI7994610.1 unnamed protein product [Parascedosporium putredinis]